MRHARSAGWLVAVVILAFLAWMAFVATLASHELILGMACALFASAGSLLTWKAMDISITANPRDIFQLWRVPWDAVRDSATATLILGKSLLGIVRLGSCYRAVPFEKRAGPRGRLRIVLATSYTSVSPNSIVLGVDKEQGLILFHQLTRSSVPETMKRLGARA